MKFKDFLKKYRISYRKFAKLSGISASTLCKYANNQRKPSTLIIEEISEITAGKVKYEDWVSQAKEIK